MDARRPKDPQRVRLGRLGALELHARGLTNVAPARAAWEAKLRASAGIDESVPPAEAKRRAELAMRARMTRLAMARWSKRGRAA